MSVITDLHIDEWNILMVFNCAFGQLLISGCVCCFKFSHRFWNSCKHHTIACRGAEGDQIR